METSAYGSTDDNARALLAQLKDALGAPAARFVVIVAVSKGTHDFVRALAMNEEDRDPALTAEEIGKIKFVVSMSGIVRSSAVAGWLVDEKRFFPRALRSFMRAPVVGKFPHFEGVESLTRDPWETLLSRGITQLKFVWVSFVVFPDGDDGQPRAGTIRGRVLRLLRGSASVGPYDGLTESAASVLPPGTGLEEWIVRVRGTHGLVKGKYLDETPLVTPGHGAAAVQIVDPLLRTLPTSFFEAPSVTLEASTGP
jgi:hypothetical protein